MQTTLKLLHLLYASAADARLWPTFLHHLMQHTRATTGMVLAFDEAQLPVLAAQSGVSDETQRAYREHFFAMDPIRERIAANAPADRPWVCLRQQLVEDRELERNEFYNDYMRPGNMYHQVGTTIGETPGFSVGGLSLLRSEQDGIFDEQTVHLLNVLAPHMRNAFLLDRKLRRLELQADVLDTVSAVDDLAFVTVGADRRILSGNAAAERILSATSTLRVTGGRLRIGSATLDQELQRLLDGALGLAQSLTKAMEPLPVYGSLSIPRGAEMVPLQLTVAPLTGEHGSVVAGGVALVFLTLPEAQVRPRGAVLKQMFGLTPTEARLADLLLTGLSLKEVADTIRLTENSARFSLKSIFRKTGVRSQSALMRLMLALRA